MISPYTGEVVPIAPIAPPRAARGDAARAAAAASATAAADQPEAAEAEELVSLEEADAEENTGKVKAVVPELEDDIEIDETIEGDDDDDSTSFPTRKRAMRTSLTSSVMSEVTKRLEIGPELWFRVMPAGRSRRCDYKGAIAQLGERLHGMQEVGGSIPPGSTSLRLLRKLRLGKTSRAPS